MTSAPKIRDFNAQLSLRPGSPSMLRVTGAVETSAGNKQPGLERARPQGINPAQLILDLGIVDTGGGGTQDVAFRPVGYEEAAEEGQYTSVLIRWASETLIVLDVQEAH